ncbi:VWA domain-containing protein [Conexibacter sp. SYSU D00693]|uniref:VWA domain-containing protein n=1 Tax=Conexibacter sp. SYSU D00693 TaxID=2812560 RepID=UPI00196AE9F9|nr:VWA domain-containing protein [Conexibacter sp. SYSU D00693]
MSAAAVAAPVALSFAEPWLLLGLLLVPLALWWYLIDQGRRRAQVSAFAAPAVAASAIRDRPGWRRHAPIACYALALALLGVALAKPERTVAVPSEQATVVLVTDRSGSMEARDVAPNRLDAARQAVSRFLDRLPRQVRAAAVAFNQRAEVIATPTVDRQELRDAFATLTPAGGTATGDALAAALRLVRPRGTESGPEAPPAAVVLLTDGASVRGRDPVDVAREARRQRVPVYTVALGTQQGTIRVRRPGGQGTEVRRVPPDPASLRRIAAVARGEAFTAADAPRLDRVYEELGSRVGRQDERREMTAGVAGAALLFVLAGGALSLAFFGRLP